ncbi:uncharacterized protein [Nicotiana tomentosiformis]|uniref:uncharacterized protein n=1 Tax=Nicotiana tomentosiformis TaxID=4098 RepID=UPI00388C7701
MIEPKENFNQPQKPPQQVEESTNNLLNKLLLDNQQFRTDFRNLERQVGQLVSNQNTRPAGALSSDTEKNPQVNAITLRNGMELEETPKKKRDKPTPEGELIPKEIPEPKKYNASLEPVSAARPPPPFPKSQVQLNIPLVDVLREIPKYAKYIKDIVAHKRRLTEFETVALTEECTSRVQNKLPQKLKDPGSFTIPQVDLRAPRPTTVMLQLADRSIAYPEGVIEDVLLQIEIFILPVDFIILDYKADKNVPIILGRPLLATGNAIIKVREVKMIMKVENEEAVFNVYKAIQLSRHYEELSMISVVEVDEQLTDMVERFVEIFMDDFSVLLEKDIPFKFDDACLKAFEELKGRLVTAPIIIAPDWAQPFELMYDASDFAIRPILGQKREKIFHSIYYTSKTLNPAQMNYIVTEKELLAVVWAFDKFRSYLMGIKVIIYTDHSAIRYILVEVDYVSKWVEAIALPTNDAKVVQSIKLSTRLSLPITPNEWSSGSVKQRGEADSGENAGEKRLLQLNELDEFRLHTYENAKLYKEKTKRWHDKHIQHRKFEQGQEVLLFNSRLKLFPRKFKSRWAGPFEVVSVKPHGAVELQDTSSGGTFLVSENIVKYYWGGDIACHKTSMDLADA